MLRQIGNAPEASGAFVIPGQTRRPAPYRAALPALLVLALWPSGRLSAPARPGPGAGGQGLCPGCLDTAGHSRRAASPTPPPATPPSATAGAGHGWPGGPAAAPGAGPGHGAPARPRPDVAAASDGPAVRLSGGRLTPGARPGPVRQVTRLPEPALVLPTVQGRLAQPRPRPAGLEGYRPAPLRPPVRRRALPAVAPAREPALPPGPAPVAGLSDADQAAYLLDMPAHILRTFVRTRPELLPPFQLVGGEPYFRREDLPAAGGAR